MVNFSIVVIARNEETTLPRLLGSLDEFKKRGGEVVVLDTGSTDKTVQVAKDWGCKVEEVGSKFIRVLDKETADAINTRFSVDEGEIVKEGDKSFHFGDARNLASSFASNNIVSMPDCDEIFTKLDIDAVEKYINDGYEQLEFNFVFAHGPNGEESIKFIQCKMYDKRKMNWNGRIHEVLGGSANRTLMPENIFKIEHYQNEVTNRTQYLIGLAIDCFENPAKDRNSHYFAREMMYRGFLKSAIKEFKRYLTIGWWDAERSKSCIHIGDCLMMIGSEESKKEALDWYHRAYLECSSIREPLIKLGKYFFDKKDWGRAIFYLEGCLNIQYSGFYADDMNHYKDYPYSMLYVAYWWFGNKEKSKEYFEKAIEINPTNPVYIEESKFYREVPITMPNQEYQEKGIDGWMSLAELEFLFQNSKEMNSILEMGSWKGRSTHALLTGCKGQVTAVDHFKGSDDERDSTNHIGKVEDVYGQFMKNVGHFKNLRVKRMSSEEAEKELKDEKFEMIFIDGEHTEDGVTRDIELWSKHCTKLLCGHDYSQSWPDVMRGVDKSLKKDGVMKDGSIWFKRMDRNEESELQKNIKEHEELAKIKPNYTGPGFPSLLAWLYQDLSKGNNFSFIKRGDGEEACMNGEKGANCDGSIYYPELGNKLKDAYKFFQEIEDKPYDNSKGRCHVIKFDDQKHYNSLLHRTDNNLMEVKKFYSLIRKDERTKIFVGPQKLGLVNTLLKTDYHIVVPELNAFLEYDRISKELEACIALNDKCIVLFSSGMMAKPLISECLHNDNNITCLDLGSAFDPLVSNTRTVQISKESMLELYSDFLPTIDIVIPTLGRPEGLKRCLDSIETLKYPKERLNVIVKNDEPRLGVAKRLNEGFREGRGELVVYGSNDIEFDPWSLFNVLTYIHSFSLISFNTGQILDDKGNICEHFIIKRASVDNILKGKIFDEEFNHVGVDNLLWKIMDNKKLAYRDQNSVIKHYHFSKGAKMDDVYELGWGKVNEDRELLAKKLKEIE